ncbi:hypothetical protein Btru_057137 [Bulinus truncatus]|nr:hypothetical protein Btru_057137 [Bulinus truncatus]
MLIGWALLAVLFIGATTQALTRASNLTDQDIDDCWSNPCQNSGTCRDGYKNYTCQCPANYNGSMCENDLAKLYGCQVSPCLNGGTCHTLQNPPAFNCSCLPGYNGLTCENKIDLCRLSPCVNGVCTSGINSYTCNCSQTGYTGVNCSVNIDECSVNPSICGSNVPCYDTPGSYTCDCNPGFSGKPCQNVDECLSQPCQNGGTCTDGINSFKCTCPPSYTGTFCGYDINDDCASSPCIWPNSKCKDLAVGYQCICQAGYTGNYTNCMDINECDLHYCQHASNCSNTPGGYTCTCQPGYTDLNCSTDINECSSNPCHNASNCTDHVNGYSCSCLPGFTGQNCDTALHCFPGKCRNNGTCQEQVNGFTCQCQPGYTDLDCGTEINECNVSTNPCSNGAQCIDLLNGYKCNCTAGYEGTNCANEINKCKLYSNPCQHNASCLFIFNDYYCNCTSDWMGKNCTEPYNACASQPCQNNGSCSSQSLSHTYSCSCAAGFSGQDCSTNIDDCRNVTCGENRICYDGINNYTCGCPIGYTGQKCDKEIDKCETQPCQNGGKCTSGRGNYTCTCPQSLINITLSSNTKKVVSFKTGYTGVNCEEDINECNYTEPSVCQNGALCQNLPAGSLCEQLRTYCDIRLANQTCQNGGTCLNLPTSSVCQCAVGYTGQFCEINIDDCQSKPCQYNGTCTDLVNNYTCTCIDGISGRNCETNINDCDPNPCLNNGICQDRINNYTCDCNNTGFTGPRCEQNIDDCASNPCQNGGNCTDGVNNYTCQCHKGYTGANCQIDIPDCSPNPCQYNSTCLEYSNKTLYDKNDTHFLNFTYEKAAGYLCVCVAGAEGENCSKDINDCEPNPCLHNSTCRDKFNNFTCVCSPGYQGANCSIEINECDVYKPCQNSGTCTDKIADYLCTCLPPVPVIASYGGKNCSTLLTGCTGNNCRNGQCVPKLDYSVTPQSHGYDCICYSGYTGRYCDILTSVSFVSPGNHFKVNMNMGALEFSVNFRTTLPNVSLLALKLMGGDAFISVYLDAGMVKLKYKDSAQHMLDLKSLLPLNDSNYHNVRLSFSGSGVILSLPGDRCAPETGSSSTVPPPCSKSLNLELQRNTTALYVGSAALLSISNEIFPRDFVGCMEDLKLSQQLYYPSSNSGNFVNVIPGCSRSVQCVSESCSRHGTCEDLWDKYRCHCKRPYYGTDCQQEYPAATFGIFNGSYVEYVFPPGVQDNYSISFFIVTRQQDGYIMMTSNSHSTTPSLFSLMALYIKNFQLSGDFFKCNFSLSISTNRSISDGQRHFISIIVNGSDLTVYVDYEKVFEKLNMPQLCKTGFGFYVDRVNFGQYRDPAIRSKRAVLTAPTSTDQNNISVLRRKRQATSILPNLSLLPYLVGVIQDFQMNGNNYSFDSAINQNFTPGAVSTRNVCQDAPCQNGGTCQDIFYNDFNCSCVRGYTGKNCTELDFCSYGSCPSESKCINIPLGYECVSEASFQSDDSSITYVMNGSIPEPIVTFNFRTRGLYGLIFLLRLGDYFFKLRVANGSLEINSKLSSAFSESATTYVQAKINDGRWYSAKFEIINETYVSLDVFHEGKIVDYTKNRIINSSSVSISDMLKYGEIVFGNTLRPKYSRNWEANFRGCLRQVRMGGVLMPFYYDDTFENNTVPVKFMAISISGIIHHCTGNNVCSRNVCLNGGQCVDNWNSFSCSCPKGFYGEYCQDNTDNCAGRYCQNGGQCLDGLDTSSCVCPVGFTNQL